MTERGLENAALGAAIQKIRLQVNPHPAGQLSDNVPIWQGRRLEGVQHEYRETVFYSPFHDQTWVVRSDLLTGRLSALVRSTVSLPDEVL